MLDARTPVRYGRDSARPHPTEAIVLAAPIQTTLELGVPLRPGHVLRRRPGDHGRLSHRQPDHRGRRGQVRGRRARRHVPGSRRPRDADPPVHHPSHGDRRPSRREPAAHPGDPARVPRVLPRLGLRGAQRAVRLLVPEREPRAAGLRAAPRSAGVHGASGAARGLARRPEREAADPRPLLQDADRTEPPGPRRRRGVRRGPARPPGSGRPVGDPHARRSPRGRSRPRPPELREDPPGRPPPARAGRLPLPRARRHGSFTSASRRISAAG